MTSHTEKNIGLKIFPTIIYINGKALKRKTNKLGYPFDLESTTTTNWFGGG
jgi:hypothetical protein